MARQTPARPPIAKEEVTAYLRKHYGMTAAQAAELVDRREAIYNYGKLLTSFIYYIGDEMVRAEKAGLPDDATHVPYTA